MLELPVFVQSHTVSCFHFKTDPPVVKQFNFKLSSGIHVYLCAEHAEQLGRYLLDKLQVEAEVTDASQLNE